MRSMLNSQTMLRTRSDVDSFDTKFIFPAEETFMQGNLASDSALVNDGVAMHTVHTKSTTVCPRFVSQVCRLSPSDLFSMPTSGLAI